MGDIHRIGHQPDSRYAWMRLLLSLVLGYHGLCRHVVGGCRAAQVQLEFGTVRAGASLPYTAAMLGFAFGSITMGRFADRYGMGVPIAIGAVLLLAGYALAGYSQSLTQFALAHGLLIGVGTAAGFGPLIADLSHWFVKRRGLAVVMAATGSYLAGVVWPQLITWGMGAHGWRTTYIAIGVVCFVIMLPLAYLLRIRPDGAAMQRAERATAAARGDLGLSPRALQLLLLAAGFSCCVAMSMPQVHIVAYCGDLGYARRWGRGCCR